jgi:hypothetical protein
VVMRHTHTMMLDEDRTAAARFEPHKFEPHRSVATSYVCVGVGSPWLGRWSHRWVHLWGAEGRGLWWESAMQWSCNIPTQ